MLFFVYGLVPGCEKKEKSTSEQPIDASSVSAERPREEPARLRPIPPEPGTWKKPQRILYVGLLETDRARDFVKFLSRHFNPVETAQYQNFANKQAEGYDVTIVDYDGTDTQAPMPKNLSNNFRGSMMTMGVPGADISSRLGLKTGYL